ncbi:MAG: methylenetetrahydrofolate reductase [Actinomycetota bacterium]|nr:methylenetetrahydrofolate reductase [Actinomycetota bacterium]MCL6093393.1 methylenetetrahydrofolate reductase [Actinomycetota bacterium]MDA8166734.1 methylenetetrahydrofolate reductase [Actinomycetota bacterium]
MSGGVNLKQILDAGGFAVTGELGPPRNADPQVIIDKANILKGHVDAVNITDNQTAIVRMASAAAAKICLDQGLEPVMQMTCRDRNRLAMQADILGAAALGISNLLCLTGDHQSFGNHPEAVGVFDLDSVTLIRMARDMRDGPVFQNGDEIAGATPQLFIGAAANPYADPFPYRALRLAKKVEAGVDFVQTQIIFNVDKFKEFMHQCRELGVTEGCRILAGVAPLKSAGMAKYMKNRVAGMDVPDAVVERMAAAEDAQDEGIQVCVDVINEVKEIEGVAGVHIMAVEWEAAVPEIVRRAHLK